MPVYMIQGEHRFGPVKIGYSYDPEIRLGQLQVSHWEELRIIRLFEGGEVEEALLHALFSDLHMRGEWHACSRAMFGDVGLVEIIPTPTEPPEPMPVLPGIDVDMMHPLRSQRGMLSKVAAALGISKGAVSMWRKVPGERVSEVARVSGLSIQQLRPDIFPMPNDGAV